jgi:hypothetical protein
MGNAVRSFIIQGAASQTANLTEWQNSAGTVIASISSGGNIASGNTSTTGLVLANDGYFNQLRARAVTSPIFYFQTGQVLLDTNGAAKIGLSVRATASQTADLQQWQNSGGTSLTGITAAGTINFASGNTSATATGGAIAAPALVTGYIEMKIAGTTVKVPYYSN